MKKTAYICLLVFIGSLFGCVDKFEEVNTNGNKMYEAELPNIFAGTVYRTMNTVAEFNFMNGNLFARYLVLGFRTTPSQDEGNGYFRKFYIDILRDLNDCELQYEGKEGFENRLAIAKTWKAYVYYVMVSMYGGIPMSDAILTDSSNKRDFKYDTELEVYTNILKLLDDAVNLYDPETPYTADVLMQDPVFGVTTNTATAMANVAKWRKFANTLRLSIAMQSQNVSMDLARENAAKAMEHEDWLIASVDEIVQPQWGTDRSADRSYYWDRLLRPLETGTLSDSTFPALAEYLAIYLFTFNDPRIEAFVEKSNARGTAADNQFQARDTITRPHVCGVLDCPDWLNHTMDGMNDFRRDSIVVGHSVPYVPMREQVRMPSGWEAAYKPGSTTERTTDPLNTRSVYNPSYVKEEFIKIDAKFRILNWADACFLKAEAKVLFGLGSKSAQEYYEDGIRASFAQYDISGVDEYMAQDGVKWGTDKIGFKDSRGLYQAKIMGSNGQEGQLEQIYKQRHFADFFNGIEGWNLERRTRAFGWSPFISGGASSNVDGLNTMYNFWTERMIYPLTESYQNKTEYYKAVDNLQKASPYARPDRWGDNIWTSLDFAKKDPALDTADELYLGNKVIFFRAEYFEHLYGTTYEEMVDYAKRVSGETNEEKALIKALDYEVVSVLKSGYLID